MSLVIPEDLEEIVASYVESGRFNSTADVLRHALQALQEQDDEVAAIQIAIDEWKKGDAGVPLDDAFEIVR